MPFPLAEYYSNANVYSQIMFTKDTLYYGEPLNYSQALQVKVCRRRYNKN